MGAATGLSWMTKDKRQWLVFIRNADLYRKGTYALLKYF